MKVTERRALVTLAILVGWITVIACGIALVRGNVNLALLISRQVVWGTVLLSAVYLLMAATNDIATKLITKNVRNLTLVNPMGRNQIEFTVALEEHADEVGRILQKLFRDHPAFFDDPKPSVYIDSLVDGRIKFNSFAFVASPRMAYGTRSELLFRLWPS